MKEMAKAMDSKVMMPGMTGIQEIQEIPEISENPGTAVREALFLTRERLPRQ
jgi:hypothetical protein